MSLKSLLEGAKILGVKKSNCNGYAYAFEIEKNGKKYSFSLSDNLDVGEYKDSKGNFLDIQDMLEVIFYHHKEHNLARNAFKAYDNINKKEMGFMCKKCKLAFVFGMDTLKKSDYYDLLFTPEKRGSFARILSQGWIGSKKDALYYLK